MRSLTAKLTLAFLFVGISGTLLVALIVGLRTQQEFNRFVESQSHKEIAAALADYYAETQSWAEIAQFIRNEPALRSQMPRVVIVDATGMIVFGLGPEYDGRAYPYNNLAMGTPIEIDDTQVGTLVLQAAEPHGPQYDRFSPERTFLSNVSTATLWAALISGLIALLLGVLLARTLTRPIHELTAATQAMTDGNLGQQVNVHSKDEIGTLAASFNQMSRDLAQASQLRKQMTADIAHDLRTPLSVLRGYTEGLSGASLEGSPKLYTIMHEEVIHLQHLVEDLRILSLADAGELPLHRRLVDPKALLERTGLAYVMQAEKQGIALRIDASDNLPSISVDLERMTQVLNNLVSNALRHTSEGEIVLSAAVVDGRVQMQVRDTGVGIPADDLPFVFNRFYRADPARQRLPDSSSGLGLAIARAIVTAHEGKITAVSSIGQGTTFIITLPVEQTPTRNTA